MCRIIFLAFFTIAQILPSFAADNSHLSSDPRVQTARTLIKNGRYAEALPLLRRLAPNHPDQTDVLFLLGLVSIRVAKNTESTDDKNALLDEAIAALRAILITHPELIRIRLELARAFFLRGNDDLSREHFERVLSSNPPPAIVYNINRFLTEIDRRRRWRWYFRAGILPEARVERNKTILINFNNQLLPFELEDGRKSGTGIKFSTGGTYTQPLTDRWNMLYGVDVERTEYKGHDFDSSVINLRVGPQIIFSPGNNVNLKASIERDFDGEEHYTNDTYSFDISGNRRWTQRFSMHGNASASMDKFGNGPDGSVSLGGQYYFSPVVLGSFSGGLERTKPKRKTNRSRSREISLGMVTLLPLGFTASLTGTSAWTDYENNSLVLDGGRRRKQVRTLQLGLLNRALTVFGFSPQLVFARQLSDTNYQLDIYKSNSWQLNFQQQF